MSNAIADTITVVHLVFIVWLGCVAGPLVAVVAFILSYPLFMFIGGIIGRYLAMTRPLPKTEVKND